MLGISHLFFYYCKNSSLHTIHVLRSFYISFLLLYQYPHFLSPFNKVSFFFYSNHYYPLLSGVVQKQKSTIYIYSGSEIIQVTGEFYKNSYAKPNKKEPDVVANLKLTLKIYILNLKKKNKTLTTCTESIGYWHRELVETLCSSVYQ